MTKLTKTQQTLIERAKTHGGMASVVAGRGRGALGGRVCFGSRERDALHKLVELGLIKIVDRQVDRYYNRGNCVHVTSWAFQLAAPRDA